METDAFGKAKTELIPEQRLLDNPDTGSYLISDAQIEALDMDDIPKVGEQVQAFIDKHSRHYEFDVTYIDPPLDPGILLIWARRH